jgi:hypothetical protein
MALGEQLPSVRHVVQQNENPARVRVRRDSREPSRGAGFSVRESKGGKHLGTVNIPHGKSGTNSP